MSTYANFVFCCFVGTSGRTLSANLPRFFAQPLPLAAWSLPCVFRFLSTDLVLVPELEGGSEQ